MKFEQIWKNNKKLILSIFLLVLVLVTGVIILAAGRSKSAVKLERYTSTQMSSLVALDGGAHKGDVENGYANFKFTEAQKNLIEELYNEHGTVAVTVRIKLAATKKNRVLLNGENAAPFMYGFLSKDDFTAKGKLIQQYFPNNKRILVQADLRTAPDTFDVSFAIQKSDKIRDYIPEGFFIYSLAKIKVVAACIVPAEIGFDLTTSIPYYGYACNGGVIDFEKRDFDFTGGTLTFPVQNGLRGSMPEFAIVLSDELESKTTSERTVRVEVNAGGEKIYINNVSAAHELIIPTAALNTPFSRFTLLSNEECVTSLIMRGTHIEGAEVLKPVRTDPGLILKYKQSAWRTLDYEIFEWDRYPGILFFDTRNYDIQDNFFRRMAFFVEKEGFKGRLLTNAELEGRHGYNAHDYSAESMAKFFNKAVDLDFPLNKEELLLKKILIQNGLFEIDGDYVRANEGGLVSISRECPEWSRINLLAHEGWHTIFFRDEEFRNFVSAVFYTMDPDSLAFLIEYFKSQPSLGYDVNDDYLMHNEFMAYIMQQRLPEVANYFVHLANRGTVINYTPKLAAYIRKTEGKGFEDAAIALNDFVFDKYGIVCGNISIVSK